MTRFRELRETVSYMCFPGSLSPSAGLLSPSACVCVLRARSLRARVLAKWTCRPLAGLNAAKFSISLNVRS